MEERSVWPTDGSTAHWRSVASSENCGFMRGTAAVVVDAVDDASSSLEEL